MADDPGTIWLTYDEAGQRLGIKADSVRRRAASRKWPRRQGNDGRARVGIPPDAIPDATPDSTPEIRDDITPDKQAPNAMVVSEDLAKARADIARLKATVEGLEERLAETRADRDRWHQVATTHRPSLLTRIRRSLRAERTE